MKNLKRLTTTLSSFCVHVADENATQEPTELEASSVKEAALDDKLGVELRSIVEQIQVAGAHPDAAERRDENSGGGWK